MGELRPALYRRIRDKAYLGAVPDKAKVSRGVGHIDETRVEDFSFQFFLSCGAKPLRSIAMCDEISLRK